MSEKMNIEILYVEDELTTRRMINGILRRRFSIVHEAKDGSEGLELFEKHNPDIVITDSKMPIMDGIEMSRAIKLLNPEIPIIFTTAYEEPEFMEKLDQIGIKWRFVKPIDVKELLGTIKIIGRELMLKAENGI
jgi:two-component system cell cycle response regulator